MKSLGNIDVGIICGTGLEGLPKGVEQIRIGTPYGVPPPISVGKVGGKSVAIFPPHGVDHSVPARARSNK